MKTFIQHSETTAPAGAAELLGKVRERYGFIPNLAAFLAESPTALEGLLGLAGAFDKTSFSEIERQLIQLTVSVENNCDYCRSAHTGMARKAGMEPEKVQAVLAKRPLGEGRLEALRKFTRTLVEKRGWASDDEVSRFLQTGYTKAQVFELVLGIALKTLTNYTNHLAGATPNPEFLTEIGSAQERTAS
jgi:uncharacterized peroxidase-related enzyme